MKNALVDTINHDGIEHAGYLSFLSILSIFPFLILLVSLAGLFGETTLGTEFVAILFNNLPSDVVTALNPRIAEIISGPPQSLLTIAILGALWTASSSVEGLRTIFNRAYRVSTPPAYIWRRLMSILQFLIIIVIILSSTLLIILLPIFLEKILNILHVGALYEQVKTIMHLSFFITGLTIFCAISFLYYVIPNLRQKWRNVFPGALLVLILWFLSGKLFTLYLQEFDQVNLIYGSLASFIVTLLFFYIIAMILIFGAEFNYAIEKKSNFKFIEKF